MKERPILFSGPMVRAILEGCKTQTRRVIKSAQACDNGPWADFAYSAQDGLPIFWWKSMPKFDQRDYRWGQECPYGAPGDRLWVRETWRPCQVPQHNDPSLCIEYRASGYCKSGHLATLNRTNWRPSIFMPRWASRITLEVVSVRVERAGDISVADCAAEGMKLKPGYETEHLKTDFRNLWNEINAKRGYSWESNPWVWVVEFKRVMP